MKKFISLLLILLFVAGTIPVFADNQTEDLVTTATEVWGSTEGKYGGDIYNSYDRNDATNVYVGKESGTVGGWIAVELAEPSVITSISVKTRKYISASNCSLGEFAGFVFEAANERDFSDAVILYDDSRTSSELENSQLITYEHNDTQSTYKYVRIRRKTVSVICFAEFYVEGYGIFDDIFSDTLTVYADTDGYYAISFEAMTHNSGAVVNIVNNSIPLCNMQLSNPGLNGYTGHYILAGLKAGENEIILSQASGSASIRNLSVEPLSELTQDICDSFAGAVNSAVNAYEVKEEMLDYLPYFGIDAGDYTDGIFYDIPVYENMADSEYTNASEIINEFLAFGAAELADPSVVLTGDGIMQTGIDTSGDYVVNVRSKRLIESCKVIAAVYEGDTLAGSGHSVSPGDVSIPLTVNLTGSGDVRFRVFYLEDFDTLRPVDAYPDVYEHIYMSASGSDDGDGSAQNPYATLDKVRERISQINDDMTGDIVVHVEDGTYFIAETVTFTEEHSGRNGYDVIITGDGIGDKPIFSGGIEVTGWNEYQDGIYRAPLTGVDDVRNLYINGYGATRARSKYKYAVEEFSGEFDSVTREQDETEANSVVYAADDGFYVSKDDIDLPLDTFSSPQDLELVWNQWWQAHRTPVDSIEVTDDKYLFHMNQPCFSTEYHDSTYPIAITEKSTFYIENALELLDEDGEFYYDKSGYIYYKPYAEEILSGFTAYVPVTETLFNVGGSSASSKISNITFKNLDIRLGAWNKVSQSGLMGTQADTIKSTDEAKTTFIPAQFTINNADNIHLQDCSFSDMGSGAVSMKVAVTDSAVTGCSFTDISGTAVSIGSPTKSDVTQSNKSTNICVTNNIFRRVASEYHQTTAIAAYYGNGFVIKNNDIKKTPYTAINVGWGWENHTTELPPDGCGYYDISRNRIEDSMLVLMDGAAIYSLDHGPSVIRENYIVNSCGPQQFGIYFDSSSRDTIALANVIEDSQRWLNIGESYISNITAQNNYYTIPLANNTGSVNEIDNTYVKSEYSAEAAAVIASAGADNALGSAAYETPDWRNERIDTIPRFVYFNNGHIRDAVAFDSCYDPSTVIVETQVTSVSFNLNETLTYELPPMSAGAYRLSAVVARKGEDNAKFKLYLNGAGSASLTGTVEPTSSEKYGIYQENEYGTIRLSAENGNTLKFKVTSGAFDFKSFKLEKID